MLGRLALLDINKKWLMEMAIPVNNIIKIFAKMNNSKLDFIK